MIMNQDYNNDESDLNHDTDKCHNYNLTQDISIMSMPMISGDHDHEIDDEKSDKDHDMSYKNDYVIR